MADIVVIQKTFDDLRMAIHGQLEKWNKYRDLEIAGLDDKEGYEAVKRAQLDLAGQRIGLEKVRKELKQEYLDGGRRVDGAAKELQALINPIEEGLKAKRQAIDDEKVRIAEEKRIREACAQLWDEAHAANVAFDERKAEARRLDEERAKLEAEKAEFERKKREEQIRRDAEEKARRDAAAELDRLERERKAAEERAARAEQDAADKLRREQEAEEQRKREAEEVEKKRLAAASDREKLAAYARLVDDIPIPSSIRDIELSRALDEFLGALNKLKKCAGMV